MKKILLFITLLAVCSAPAIAQMGIGTTSPDGSAMLDVVSNAKGLLAPRMTSTERGSIPSPTDGLLVYDTDTHSFWFYKSGTWTDFGSGGGLWSRTGTATWLTNTSDYVGIGITSPLAKLHINSVEPPNHQDIYGLFSTFGGKNAGVIFKNNSGGEQMRIYQKAGQFSLNVSNTSNTDIFTIQQDGKVGIGTTAPQAKLHIYTDGLTELSLKIDGLVPYNPVYDYQYLVVNGSSGDYGTVATAPFLDVNLIWSTSGNWDTGSDMFLGTHDNTPFSLITNGWSRMRITETGKVGIGTTDPTNTLHVLSTSNPLRLEGLQTSTNTGVLVADGNGVITTNSNIALGASLWREGEGASISPASDEWAVGIGTTTPQYTLDVYGTGRFKGYVYLDTVQEISLKGPKSSADNWWFLVQSPWGNKEVLWLPDNLIMNQINSHWSLGGNMLSEWGEEPLLGSLDNFPINLITYNEVRMRITETGNIGIGTTAPANKFHITESSSNNSFVGSGILTADIPLSLQNTNPTVGNFSFIGFKNYSNTYDAWIGAIHRTNPMDLSAAGDIVFVTRWNVGTIGEKMRIGYDGHVGIGNSLPDNVLEIMSNPGMAEHTQLTITNTRTDYDPLIAFELVDGTSTFTMGVDDSDGDKFKIGTTSINVNTRLTIDGSGNVGIGTSAPAVKLDVNGSTQIGVNGTTVANVIKATVSKDVANVPANSSIIETFAVPNAATTASVMISPQNALADGLLISYARVSAAGTIEVKFRNVTAAAINPATMNFYLTVVE